MALVVVFDELSTPQKVLEVLPSANTPQYEGRADALINPDLSGVAAVPREYWKHEAGAVVEFTQAEKDAQDAADLAMAVQAARVGAIDAADATPSDVGVQLRAVVMLAAKRINWLTARVIELQNTLVDVAASNGNNASSIRDAITPHLPFSPTVTVTRAQVIQAYKNDINAGEHDS